MQLAMRPSIHSLHDAVIIGYKDLRLSISLHIRSLVPDRPLVTDVLLLFVGSTSPYLMLSTVPLSLFKRHFNMYSVLHCGPQIKYNAVVQQFEDMTGFILFIQLPQCTAPDPLSYARLSYEAKERSRSRLSLSRSCCLVSFVLVPAVESQVVRTSTRSEVARLL